MNTKDIDNKIPIYQLDSKEKVLEYYVNWTKKGEYNKNMISWNYQAPQNTVKLFNKHTPNKEINILDAGCGSGLVGIELQKNGYTKITGADFSQEMLDLIPNNIYHHLELIDLNEKLKYEDNFFDAITCVGTFTYSHVKANALNELIRILKKNGLICFTINEGIYKKYQFDLKIKQLSDDKLWDIIDISKCSYIVNKNIEAWLCIAKKN
ncbi:MAG: class I SAM-dependent DNA methyltransferase [Alphaproteobacteria bacterium]